MRVQRFVALSLCTVWLLSLPVAIESEAPGFHTCLDGKCFVLAELDACPDTEMPVLLAFHPGSSSPSHSERFLAAIRPDEKPSAGTLPGVVEDPLRLPQATGAISATVLRL